MCDFVEMGFHHILAMYLMGGMYLFNVWEIGSVIAFLHDIADINTGLIKMLSESIYTRVTGIFFIFNTFFVWLWTRMLVLPWCIYSIWITDVDFGKNNNYIVKPFFCYLLSAMCLLHYYWFYLFI